MNGKKAKVLIVGPVSPPFGGVESVVETILGSTLSGRYELLHLSTSKKMVSSSMKGRFGFSNFVYGIFHSIKFFRMILFSRPDLVYLPVGSTVPGFLRDSFLISIAWLMRCPVVGHLHGGTFDLLLESSGRIRKKWVFGTLSRLDTLIVLSDYWKKLIKKDLPEGRVEVAHNAVGPEWLLPLTADSTDGKIRVLFGNKTEKIDSCINPSSVCLLFQRCQVTVIICFTSNPETDIAVPPQDLFSCLDELLEIFPPRNHSGKENLRFL